MRPAAALLALCLVAILASAPVVAEDKVPAVMVSNYSLNPPFMSPDGIGTITIAIRQIGKTTVMEKSGSEEGTTEWRWSDSVAIDRVTLEGNGITVLNPFFEDIGEIGPDMTLPFTFTIRAPSKSGIYYPEVRILTSGGEVRYPVPVNVNTPVNIGQRAIIVMNSSLPDSVSPGDEIPVGITLSNKGGTLADKVTLKVSNISDRIAPKSSDVFYIGRLDPGGQASQDIILLSDWDTPPGLISIPVTIAYSLADGTEQTETASIDLIVRGRSTLGLVSVGTFPDPVVENQSFDMTVWIRNSGTGEARKVMASVDLPFTGSNRSFIGTITPGSDADAEFVMDGGLAGPYLFNATITYTDELGVHSMVQQLTLRVEPGDPVGTVLVIVFVLLVVLGGLLAFIFLVPKKKAHEPGEEPGSPGDPGTTEGPSTGAGGTLPADEADSSPARRGDVADGERDIPAPVHPDDKPEESKQPDEQEIAVRMMQATGFVAGSDFRQAEEACEALAKAGYSSPRLLNLQAACRFAKGDLPAAALLLEQAVWLEPDSPYLWENLGRIYRKAGNREKAESCEETGRRLREKLQ